MCKEREDIMELLEQAKQLIRNYWQREFEYSESDDRYDQLCDLSNVPLAYTTLGDDEVPIQISANLIDFKATTEIDEKIVHVDSFSSLQEMIDDYLSCLDFDSLISDWSDCFEIH